MRKTGLLLLAVALGCADTGSVPRPDHTASVNDTAPSAATPENADGITLPSPTATRIRFSCPGMT